ncbi:hypothetical protein J7L27_02435 [Candidatus Bathyarchaeota archaeon]|nr:hypothetical protein [Candidatus Bathyarchaeota archaeon]
MRRHKRCYLRIMADILLVLATRRNTKKTHIMYGANLNYTLLNRYLNDALNANLIRRGYEGYYEITDKGKIFLDVYQSYVKEKEEIEEKIMKIKSKEIRLQRLLSTSKENNSLKNRISDV